MSRKFRTADEGMTVMSADGDVIGTVEKVKGDRAHIRPDGSLATSIRQKLGWEREGQETYELHSTSVDEFTDDSIRLKRTL
jgi:hypothetical protein